MLIKRSGYNLQNILMSKAITVSNSRKNYLVNLVQAFSAMGLLSKVEFLDSVLDLSKKLTIKLPEPFTTPQ